MSDIALKFFVAEKAEVNEEDRTIVSYISTESLDRDKEIVLAKGADLDNYRKNPIVLWGHDSKATPIGKNLWIRHDGRGLLAKTQYAKTPKAEEIWQLRKDGFLKGYSIGFIPKAGKTADGMMAYGPPHEKELKTNPEWSEARNIVRAWELLEYSDVPIPSNPDSLQRAYVAKSVVISPETAKELQLSAPEPEPIRIYSFGEHELSKAVKKARKQLKKLIKRQITDELPEIIKEQLHVARGGV